MDKRTDAGLSLVDVVFIQLAEIMNVICNDLLIIRRTAIFQDARYPNPCIFEAAQHRWLYAFLCFL